MNKVTKLMAALALLLFIAPPLVGWGQTTVSYGWETSDDATQWTITDAIVATSGQGNTGTYAGKINTNHTYVQFNEKVFVTSFSFAFKRTSNNNNYNVYIETSTDGSTWTAVETYAMSSFSNGTYSTKTHTFDGTTEYYVRFHCYNTTAVRYVDDVSITYNTSAVTVALPTFSPDGGSYTSTQNVTISCETEGSTIYYTTDGSTPDNTSTQYDGAITVSETTTINAIAYVGNDASNVATATYTIVNLEHAGTEADPYSVADARTAIDANLGTNGVYATGIVSAIPTAWNTQYNNITFNFVDNQGDTDFLQAYRCVSGSGVDASTVAVGDVVVVYGDLIKYGSTYEFGQGCQLVSLTHPVVIEPSVTVTPATVTAPVEGGDGVLNVTYENITTVAAEIAWYEATGAPLQDGYDWIDAEIDADNNVYYVINANNGEARTAYLKVWAYDDDLNEVYSNLVTIEQDEYVAPTYAELPFSFNGGKADIENTDGLYQEGLGTDYNASTNPNTQLKFDGTGDWLLLQFNERPGTLTFNIKGNSFSGGTFTVQTSEDGETFTDFAVYTDDNLTNTVQNEEFTTLGENVRYIKWIYTNKATGNVGLGNINLAEYVEPVLEPSITLNTSVSVPAEGGLDIIPVEYVNIDDTQYPELLYYNENQEQVEASYYEEWITLNFDNDDNVQYNCDPNTNVETRSIYFKVLAHDYDNNEVTSDLVTITQDAYVAPASITVNPDMVEATAAGGDGTLSIILNNMTISTDTQLNVVYCYENGEFITNLDDMPNWLECIIMEDNEAYVVYYSVGENLGTEAQTAYFKVYGLDDNGTTEAYSNLVTITQEAGETPVAESWVLTDIADLTEGDVFVIVGTDADDDTFALPNNATSAAPAATSITVANGMLATEPDDVLKWNISGNATDGYIFYPNGDTENWLYCTNTNNGVRVGTNDAKVFSLDEETGYLKHNGTGRYIGVYNSQDWRCYTNTTGNIADQTIAFYKKVGEPQPSITVNPDVVDAPAAGKEGTLSITLSNMTISDDERLDIVYYYATGEQITNQEDIPNWLECIITEDNDAYVVYYSIGQNMNTEAQTAYFKVYGIDDDGTTEAYSNLVTITQEAAPQLYDLTVEPFENLEIITFVNDEMVMEADGTIQVTEGAQVMLSIVADEGYVIETLMVNGVDHAADIAEDFTYTFEMPAEAVTISATAVEAPTPVGGDYVRITSLDQLTDGSKVIFAARFDDNATEYYAMSNTSSGKPTGVLFTSATADEDEVLPASIVDEEDSYYWTVGVSADGYTFTNANGELIGYSSSTNFATGGDNTEWSIESGTSVETAMVPNYTGFVITNVNNDGRAFALNTSHNFGPYAKSNMNNNSAGNYNFYLDLFVQNEAPTPTETYTLEITGYGDSEGGYYLIASPVASDVRPSAENGFLTDAYDLYWFDQTEDEEWRNYEAGEFDLVSGMGYLYASQEGTTLTFTGTPYDGDGSVSLVKDDEAQLKGWNLVGNPFGVPAYIDRDFYKMNPQTGAELIQSSGEIAVMQGIFVIANEDGENLTFTPEATDQSANLTLNLSQSRGVVIDRAIVRFGEGRQLPKFQLNAESTKLYIPQGNNDYAVVNCNAQGEMPVNFKAQNNGTYTISINTENLEANYLHLIDNMTGTNIDLLRTPSYTFEAKTTDYASRFRLVFNVTGVEENTTCTEPFAFFNGSEWVVSNMGEATLQVVDMLGRIVSSETVNGNATMTTANLGAGVYVMRLVNGENVKIQKIIIK